MKIINLKAQNIKNLRAVEITREGNVVRLTGKNGAGKSAVLDSILTALTGKRLEDPIRHGEERAEVTVDMGDFRVRKIWTEKGERIEVTTPEGDTKKSPQTFLDEIIGKLTFDPLAFKNMKPADQLELLRSLVGLDFSDLTAEAKKVYDDRTVLNSKIKDALAQLKNAEAPDPKTPDEELSFKAELEKFNQIREKRNAFLKAVDVKTHVMEAIDAHTAEIEALEAQIEQLRAKKTGLQIVISGLEQKLAEFVLPPEVTEIQITEAQLALEDIEKKNVDIRAAKRYRANIKAGEKLKQESDALTQRLERIEQDKATRIAAAQFPIPGLSLSDNDVVFEGIPFSRLSTGQQIRVSTAIAMKLNPVLKVIFIREGSLLDDASKIEIFNLASENDYDVWMEEVDETGVVGVYIENGAIAAIDGEKVAAQDAT